LFRLSFQFDSERHYKQASARPDDAEMSVHQMSLYQSHVQAQCPIHPDISINIIISSITTPRLVFNSSIRQQLLQIWALMTAGVKLLSSTNEQVIK